MGFTFIDVSKIMNISLVIFITNLVFLIHVSDSGFIAATTGNNGKSGQNNKYILQWSDRTKAPFNFMGEGNSAFIKNNCEYTNCFVTDDASFLDITDFDAIVFNGRNVIEMKRSQLPRRRSQKQKYIFAGTESADRFPACNEFLDNFFNWTWTYKVSSDFRFGYVTIYDLVGYEVGPAVDMKWPKYMEPVSEDVKAKVSNKIKAAATFISDCNTNSKREDFIAEVDEELKKFGWNVDVYGSCGALQCDKKDWRVCNKKLQEDYFFYFAFENSFAEDYVTEKILLPLNNYAVPVVYGSANYSRFLPPGSYLDARKLGPKKLAHAMKDVMNDRDRYLNFFRWRNHYIYEQTLMNTDICRLCEVLNDEEMVHTASVWRNFRQWWSGEDFEEKCAR